MLYTADTSHRFNELFGTALLLLKYFRTRNLVALNYALGVVSKRFDAFAEAMQLRMCTASTQ